MTWLAEALAAYRITRPVIRRINGPVNGCFCRRVANPHFPDFRQDGKAWQS